MKAYISKMDARELFRQLVYLYINARKPIYYHPCIRRGKSHSIASQVEDLFTFFLSLNLTEDCSFLVDQPLNYRKKRLYPDISVVKNGVITHVFDIKTDLGWNRDGFTKFCHEKQKIIEQFRSVTFSATDGITKQKFQVKADGVLHYHIIILSGCNIASSKLEKHLKDTERLKNVHVYVLFPDDHPNYYGSSVEDFINSAKINEKDFNRIKTALTKAST